MIRSDLKKVRNLLDESLIYSVPDYQRKFEWKRDHAEDFWNDISEGSVFLGTLVLDTVAESSGQISIVDGQQRITTIFVLLAACRQHAKKIKSTDQAFEIGRKISSIDDTSGRASTSKLIPSPSILEVFNNTIANPDWDGKKFDLKSKKRQVNKIRPIYEFFSEKLADLDKDELSDLLKRLYESTFIKIEVEGTQEALAIFERTNARGMELNEADLVKKYLFEKNASNQLREDWETIVENSSENIVRLLKYYYVSHSGPVQKRDLFKKLKKHGETIGPEKLLKGIMEFAQYYGMITSPSLDGIVEWAASAKNDFFRKEYKAQDLLRVLQSIKLFAVSQGHPLIIKLFLVVGNISDPEAKTKASEKLLTFLQTVEKFHFVNYAVSQRPGNQIETYYADKCIPVVTGKNIVEFMKTVVKDLQTKIVGQAEFVEKFSTISYENDFTLIYYIFDRFNNVGREGGQYITIFNTNSKLIRKSYDIDHLVAQDTSNYDFNEEEMADYIDGIGNLLVISKHTNGSLQNNNISEKLDVLRELEAQNLPEAKLLTEEWKDLKWDSAAKAISHIKERATRLAERAYSGFWKI